MKPSEVFDAFERSSEIMHETISRLVRQDISVAATRKDEISGVKDMTNAELSEMLVDGCLDSIHTSCGEYSCNSSDYHDYNMQEAVLIEASNRLRDIK